MTARTLAARAALAALIAAVAAAAPAAAQEKDAAVPLTGIVLFTSGVGYFQHDGSVEGDSRMELTFSAAGINDILKSLILRDFDGGTVSGVTYASRDPLTRTLKSFAIDLTGSPGVAEILEQARGRPVEVSAPDAVSGTVLGVEQQVQQTPEKLQIVSFILDLLTPQGIKSIALSQVQSIRFLEPSLQADLETALSLLGTSRDLDKKRVAIHFSGKGRRRVQVGYIQEAPVWKTSYRLALGDKAPFLQGWAVVENTTDRDWRDVRLTLVSGRPITFTMDLYSPLYVQRPNVELPQYSSLAPRTYEMAMGEGVPEEPAPQRAEMAAGAAQAPSARKAAPAPPPAAPRAARAESFALSQGVSSAARAGAVGELFQYAIDKPVSLPRQQSALLPIVNQEVGGEKYSIYNEGVEPAHPLNAVKLKNSSGLQLMPGPVTVFDEGSYAGDAQVSDFPAGAEQFLSYAVDLDTEVEPQAGASPQDLFAVTISKGIIITTYKLSRERDYQVKNRGRKSKSVIIEHPLASDWTLIEPKQPMERSRDVYRFLVPVDAGKTKRLAVKEERLVDQSAAVTGMPDDMVGVFIRSQSVSREVKDALQKLLALKGKLAASRAARQGLEAQVQGISAEQSRIRSNMGALEKGSPLYNRYVKTLSDQEDQLARLAADIAKARADEADRQKDVDAFVLSLDVK